jgi:hypothetical protein
VSPLLNLKHSSLYTVLSVAPSSSESWLLNCFAPDCVICQRKLVPKSHPDIIQKSVSELLRDYRKANNLSGKDFINLMPSKPPPSFLTKLEVYGEIESQALLFEVADIIKISHKKILNIFNSESIEDYHKILTLKTKDLPSISLTRRH